MQLCSHQLITRLQSVMAAHAAGMVIINLQKFLSGKGYVDRPD